MTRIEKVGVSLFVVTGGLILFVVLPLIPLNCWGRSLSLQQYDRIERGMTEADVELLLGKPDKQEQRDTSKRYWEYNGSSNTVIAVYFTRQIGRDKYLVNEKIQLRLK